MKRTKFLLSFILFSFVAASIFAEPKYISPNSGGPKDSLVIPFKVSDKRYIQGWSLVIMDSNRNVVRTIENKVALPTKVGFKGFFKQFGKHLGKFPALRNDLNALRAETVAEQQDAKALSQSAAPVVRKTAADLFLRRRGKRQGHRMAPF